jgi:hypothetical protein
MFYGYSWCSEIFISGLVKECVAPLDPFAWSPMAARYYYRPLSHELENAIAVAVERNSLTHVIMDIMFYNSGMFGRFGSLVVPRIDVRFIGLVSIRHAAQQRV